LFFYLFKVFAYEVIAFYTPNYLINIVAHVPTAPIEPIGKAGMKEPWLGRGRSRNG